MSYAEYSLGVPYSSAEMQSMYCAVAVGWAYTVFVTIAITRMSQKICNISLTWSTIQLRRMVMPMLWR